MCNGVVSDDYVRNFSNNTPSYDGSFEILGCEMVTPHVVVC
jgi:hypothetical protein